MMNNADRVKAATGRADMQKQYQAVTSANRIPLLQNGTIDIECGSTTNNSERGNQELGILVHAGLTGVDTSGQITPRMAEAVPTVGGAS